MTTPSRHSPHAPHTPGPVAMAAGALVGAVGALVFGLCEAAVIGRAGLPLPDAASLWMLVALQATTGAVFGAIVGVASRTGAGWWLAWVLTFGAWLLSGKFGMWVVESGGAAWAGPLILVPAAIAVGLVLGAMDIEDGFKAAGGTALFTLLALGLPMNLHLLGSPTARIALVVDAVIVVAAVALAAIGWLVGERRDRHGPVFPLVALGLLGGLATWPLVIRDEAPWPVAVRADLPPIVVVVIDTLRADHLGVYGYRRPTSPRLDARARRALVYEQATASSSWTLPSVASLLTGQVAARHGAGPNPGTGSTLSPLRPSVPYLPAALADAGYVSVGITTNPFLGATFGFARGFDRYDDAAQPIAMPSAAHPLHALGLDLWPVYRDAETITARALSFVEAQPAGGYFLLVHYMDVHGPHAPTDADRAAVGQGDRGSLVDSYDASIHRVDRALDALLDALPRAAWVIVTSDHGEQLTERRDVPEGAPPTARHGHTLFQEQLWVPLIVWGPGVSGRRVARPVSLLDVAPTLWSIARLPPPERFAGAPLPEVVGGGVPERPILADSVRWGTEQQAIRTDRHKLIRWHRKGWRLYALERGAIESTELVVASDPFLQTTARQLEAQLPQVGLAALDGPAPIGFEVRSLLRRLGYLSDDAPATGP